GEPCGLIARSHFHRALSMCVRLGNVVVTKSFVSSPLLASSFNTAAKLETVLCGSRKRRGGLSHLALRLTVLLRGLALAADLPGLRQTRRSGERNTNKDGFPYQSEGREISYFRTALHHLCWSELRFRLRAGRAADLRAETRCRSAAALPTNS